MRRQVEPVAMLERENRPTRMLVIAHDGPRLVEMGSPGMAGGAQCFRTGIDLERQAATIAHRPVEELDLLPADATERAGLGTLRTAGNAHRRKHEDESGADSAIQACI